MIRRLLIANRGEIAVRIIRACRELHIESIAVYSEADENAAHVAAADRAVPIGAAPATESYLNTARVLDAARRVGAEAIHPGYGFLSQSAAFASACEQAGLVFVGPSARSIALMGSKIEARLTMERAGVPVVPGVTPSDQSDRSIESAARTLGLPVLIKASAGGGGKGMRRVHDPADLLASLQAARREAHAAFGDGTLYVEQLIERPHHVEVQVMADAHGHTVHLFERECSVQRRHQKIIEESPSPNITARLRSRLTDAAVAAARACEYRNAGTVEFLVDVTRGVRDDAPFYFLEMNTRLQVEHGVTEMVTAVDLVHAQLRVAAGEPLPWQQENLTQAGHAIEARIYAEDTATGFLPQAGRLLLYREPRIPGIRIDSGVREEDEVSVYYDALLAKTIAFAETRELATARLDVALRDFPILGIRTNVPLLLRILNDPRFVSGGIDTAFLDSEGAALLTADETQLPRAVVEAVDAFSADAAALSNTAAAEWDPWVQLRGWRA